MDLAGLLGSLLTGGAALGGVYLAGAIKSRDDRDARRENRNSDRAKIAIDRSEHAYATIDHMRIILLSTLKNNLRFYRGEIDALKRNEDSKEIPDNFAEQMAKTRFSLEVYIPDAAKGFEIWRLTTSEMLQLSTDLNKKMSDTGSIANKDIEAYEELIDTFRTQTWGLCTDIAKAVATLT